MDKNTASILKAAIQLNDNRIHSIMAAMNDEHRLVKSLYLEQIMIHRWIVIC